MGKAGKDATSEGGDNTVIYYSTDGGETWTEEVPTRTDAGETKVIVKAEDPNYETVTDEYVIVVTRKTAKVTAENKVKVYGDPNPVFTAVVTGLIGEDTIAYDVALEDESACVNVGTYSKVIIASGDEVQGNYTVVYEPADFTITPAVLAVSGTSLSKEYDGTPLVSGYPSVSVVEGTVMTYSTDGGKTWTDELPSITDAGKKPDILQEYKNSI